MNAVYMSQEHIALIWYKEYLQTILLKEYDIGITLSSIVVKCVSISGRLESLKEMPSKWRLVTVKVCASAL